ncbi:MAG TPA: PASTA domain-containing protein [Gemmatimonadales bacterium]
MMLWLRSATTRRRLQVAGVLAAAALAGWLVSLLAYPAPLVEREKRLPLVVGLSYENAQRELESQGFRVKVRDTREPDPALPAGDVTWQDPPGYLGVPEGSVVELTLSAGPAPTTVPDVMFFDLEEARKVIAAAGLTVGGIDSVPADVDRGVVVSTRPPQGTTRPPGDRVDVVVSRGPAAVVVPDVVGLPEVAAREQIEDAGLRIGLVRIQRGGRAGPSTVLSQRPNAGSLLPRGGRMDLVVSERPR